MGSQLDSIRSAPKYRGTRCLNCEHPLDISEKYCSNCGQLNSTKKLSFNDFFSEFFSGIMAYDSRLRRTLATLLFSPGQISKDYIAGKRIRYANPFKFYLSASIVFFLIWNLISSLGAVNSGSQEESKAVDELTDAEFIRLRQDLENIPGLKNSPLDIDSLLATRRTSKITTPSYRLKYISQPEIDSMGMFKAFIPQVKLYDDFFTQTSILIPSRALDSLHHTNNRYNRWAYKKVVDFNSLQKDPNIFLDYFLSKLPFIIFFYLPVFALFIWLVYWRKYYNYMEHLIFTFHIQTTFFVLITLSLVLDHFLDTDIFTEVIILVFLFYLYKALRKFYGQGRFKTLVKFILLNGIFLTLAIIAAMLSLIASFAIY